MPQQPYRQDRNPRCAAWRSVPALLAAALVAVPAAAAGDSAANWTPVDSAILDALRGGFTTPAGLEVSLGIERTVMLNGDIVAHTTVQIADLASLSAPQAEQTRAALSSLNLVQSGPDNMAVAPLAGTVPAATLVQNTLDGQRIGSSTVIHSSVNSIGLLTALNFQASLRDALSRSALSY